MERVKADPFYDYDRRTLPQESIESRGSNAVPEILGEGGGAGGVNKTAPLTATYNADDGKTTITGGFYTLPGSNAPVAIPAITTPQNGAYAYLIIQQSSAGVLAASNPVRLEVSTTVKAYSTIIGSGSSAFISLRNVLLAAAGTQYKAGNVALYHWCQDGYPHHEPLFTGG